MHQSPTIGEKYKRLPQWLEISQKVSSEAHCSKSSFFVQNSTLISRENCRFLGVKNSWKCCGIGLFSCWQLCFLEKHFQKFFLVKNSSKLNFRIVWDNAVNILTVFATFRRFVLFHRKKRCCFQFHFSQFGKIRQIVLGKSKISVPYQKIVENAVVGLRWDGTVSLQSRTWDPCGALRSAFV